MKAWLPVLLLSATLLAGCTSEPTGPVVPEQDEEGRYVIKMLAGLRFSPEEAEIPEGATVVWVNEGGVHNVHEANGLFKTTTSGSTGEHFEYTFEDAGAYEYWCDPHRSSGMVGTITVG